jgi:hypothetical protein
MEMDNIHRTGRPIANTCKMGSVNQAIPELATRLPAHSTTGKTNNQTSGLSRIAGRLIVSVFLPNNRKREATAEGMIKKLQNKQIVAIMNTGKAWFNELPEVKPSRNPKAARRKAAIHKKRMAITLTMN